MKAHKKRTTLSFLSFLATNVRILKKILYWAGLIFLFKYILEKSLFILASILAIILISLELLNFIIPIIKFDITNKKNEK